jgi:hypothetical protein
MCTERFIGLKDSLFKSTIFKKNVNPGVVTELLPPDEIIAPIDLLEPYEHPYVIPRQKDVRDVYGICGEQKLDKQWTKDNLVTVIDLPGYFNQFHSKNKPGSCILYDIHYKMVPALREALYRCVVYGVIDEIVRIGGFNWRLKKTNNQLSMHSWGIALDINPDWGRMKLYQRGKAPKPWSKEWWAVWPKGPSEKLVQAFKEAGYIWGGDWETCPDPMHFQLATM